MVPAVKFNIRIWTVKEAPKALQLYPQNTSRPHVISLLNNHCTLILVLSAAFFLMKPEGPFLALSLSLSLCLGPYILLAPPYPLFIHLLNNVPSFIPYSRFQINPPPLTLGVVI